MISVLFTLFRFLCLLAIAFAITSCGETQTENSVITYDQVTMAEWNAVAEKRILFGHQSVGENILLGVRTLATQDGAKLSLTELANASPGAGVVHFKIGKNRFPLSKIKAFEDAMQSAAAQGADVALMKFCYLDIEGDTDVKALADAYITSLDKLSRQFPKTTFVAVSAPLTTLRHGVKAWVKRALGSTPDEYADNSRRQVFNNLLREKYAGQGRLFDLAKIESDHAPESQYKGAVFEALNPAISSDGGHLNAQGQRLVAAKLMKFIAQLPRQQQ